MNARLGSKAFKMGTAGENAKPSLNGGDRLKSLRLDVWRVRSTYRNTVAPPRDLDWPAYSVWAGLDSR